MQSVGIIGGGLSGLCAAWYLHQRGIAAEIFEAGPEPGGKIQTFQGEGFTCESGPNGYLDSRPDIVALGDELGLNDLIQPADESAARRFICARGRLHEIHAHPVKFMRSNLLSWPAKLRLMGEHIAAKPPQGDESLAHFGTRKLGREAFELLIDPMASGVYAGDPERMSVQACFPRICQLERDYGSLTRAMFAIKREKKRQGDTSGGGPSGPAGVLTSYRGGLRTLIQRLREASGVRMHCNTPVLDLHRTADGRIGMHTPQQTHHFDRVILATPAWDAADILQQQDAELAGLLRRIEPSPINVICLGFNAHEIDADVRGFGFLVPGRERRRILGSLWTSSIFPDRAPEGIFLTRCMVGGARRPDLAELDDDASIEIVQQELRELLGIDANPVFTKVFRWERGIPQYNIGHLDTLESIDRQLESHPGLALCGNSYRGISLNDCVISGREAAERIAASLA